MGRIGEKTTKLFVRLENSWMKTTLMELIQPNPKPAVGILFNVPFRII